MSNPDWKDCTFVRKLTLLCATGFGLGFMPIASGTFGAVLGVVIVVGLRLDEIFLQVGLSVLLAAVAVVICDIAEKHLGTKDDGRIVADEYMTFPICVIALPWQELPWLLVIAFLTHRFFDIVKPFPARRLQDLHGGVGIVIDDVISSIYALAANHLILWLYLRYTAV